ncbi:zinc finger domain-containing protein [Streptomyces axinellae]|uniref:zinc finger domain-containing protein n=1 Tax=Streptomyces axinellae TaxID=552788 RepID=UPI003CD054B5
MDLTPDQAALALERHDCPNCDAPAGSACRTRGGKTAAKYHTPRFVRSSPRSARNWRSPSPPTALLAAHGSSNRRSPSPRPAPSDR